MLKKIYLQRGAGLRFFFGDHWDPNEAIPTGFAHITVFHRKPPLINLYFEKKTGLQRGLEWGVFFGGHWDPNEHIPTGFALMAIILQKNFRCLQYWVGGYSSILKYYKFEAN